MRALRDRDYRQHLLERFGFLPATLRATTPGALWFHAVSVGEVLCALSLIRRVKQSQPRRRVYLSCGTVAGRRVAEQKLHGLASGVFYAPLDYRFAVRKVLRALQPSVVVVLETEIWPNLYREARRAGAGLLIVNGRISDRSLPRYRWCRWLFSEVLKLPQAILVQGPSMAERFRCLGAPSQRVIEAGNLKFDFDPEAVPPPPEVHGLIEQLQPDRVWIAASTMPPLGSSDPDEDDAVLDAFEHLAARHPRLLLILAPRRPERFELVASKLAERRLNWVRRSSLRGCETLSLPGVLLLDSIGELAGVYRFADVVFVGGSLARRGGHNVLEPAFFGSAVVVGPHNENFAEIVEEFRRENAIVVIERPEELGDAIAQLLNDDQKRKALGERARNLANRRRGATERALRWIEQLSRQSIFVLPPCWAGRVALRPATWLWTLGSELKKRIDLLRQKRLGTPVVSVGGLTVGGAGKTPLVLALCRWLCEASIRPAVLTRGYRRRKTRPVIARPGQEVDPVLTGDESQLLIKSGCASVGISADRYRVGRELEVSLKPDLFLLDDGFQHWRLARDLDIVLVDALDPAGGGALVPLGRLREGLDALRRAHVVVITRCREDRPIEGIEQLVRKYNPHVPIYHARVVARDWWNAIDEQPLPLAQLSRYRVYAFCGLARPASFWASLEELDLQVSGRRAFPDHHRYGVRDLRELAAAAHRAKAEVLVTTEKDLVNLCPDFPRYLAGMPLYCLRIDIELEEREELVSRIAALVREKERSRVKLV